MIVVQVYEEDLAENISEFLATSLGAEVKLISSADELSQLPQDEVELIIYLSKYDLGGESLTKYLNESGLSQVPVILLVNDTGREDLANSTHYLLKLPFELEELIALINSLRPGPTVVS